MPLLAGEAIELQVAQASHHAECRRNMQEIVAADSSNDDH
jgi:hypothetical protein